MTRYWPTTMVMLLFLPLTLWATNSFAFDVEEFLQQVKELRDSSKFSHGKYIQGGLYAQAIAGINQQMAFAALGPKERKQLGAYCVGGQVVTTSAGVGAAGETGQTLGCGSIEEYSGAFLSFSAGGKFLLGASVSYSLGLDIHALLNHLSEWLIRSTKEERLRLKISLTQTLRYMSDNDLNTPEFDILLIVLNKFLPDLIDQDEYQRIAERLESDTAELASSLDNTQSSQSLGGKIKKSLLRFEKVFMAANSGDQNAWRFIKGITSFFTGCDSIGIAGDIGASIGGGVTVQLSDYVLLTSVDYRYIEKLDFEVNRLWSDNPELDSISYKKALTEVGKFSKNIAMGAYQCSIRAQSNTMTYVGQAKRLMQKKYFTFNRNP